KMDSEEMFVDADNAEIINAAKIRRNAVVAVGTTTMKALESAVTMPNRIKAVSQWTNKFIFPPYEFTLADAMITNFHLPKSPMMMQAAAFADYDFLMKAYKEAIANKYRFFTYGDAMLIL
ncbi:MAG: S-adenosylmethionine:tRNA ribosyltransferase-isomerase, partial [Ignavibacteria bacterium]|nr:S-adenosylmethionine:tRNA ribosyltransferase-isomerase [Ignavibacteria bacterium]